MNPLKNHFFSFPDQLTLSFSPKAGILFTTLIVLFLISIWLHRCETNNNEKNRKFRHTIRSPHTSDRMSCSSQSDGRRGNYFYRKFKRY